MVKYISDRIGVMYRGQIVELTTSDELYANPIHPYTKSLLSAIPLPDPDYERNRKRIVYDPSQHNYGSEAPTMREIRPDISYHVRKRSTRNIKRFINKKRAILLLWKDGSFYYIKELYTFVGQSIYLKNRRYKSHVSLVISICKITELEQKHSPLVLQV